MLVRSRSDASRENPSSAAHRQPPHNGDQTQPRVEAHLRACPNCTAYLEQIRITIALTGAVESDDLTPEGREDLSALYRRWRSG